MDINKVKIDLEYIAEGVSFIYPLYSPEGARILDARVVLTGEIIRKIKAEYGPIVYYSETGGRAAIPHYRMKTAYNVSREIIEEISRSDKLSKASYRSAEKMVEDILNDITSSDVEAIVLLKELRDFDEYLYNHSVNVGVLTAVFARLSAKLKHEELKSLTLGAYLHDVGQRRIDPQLLKKEGKLDISEFQKIKRHPQLGYEIVRHISGNNPILLQSILFHHEKFNNRGYYELPYEHLPIFPKIVSICDIYDALTSKRPFRKDSMTVMAALKTIFNSIGSHFDRAHVTSFLEHMGPVLNPRRPLLDKNDICELNTQELALVLEPLRPNSLRPKVLVFCKFIRSGKSLSVKFNVEPYELDLEAEQDRHIEKIVNNSSQVKTINRMLAERWILPL